MKMQIKDIIYKWLTANLCVTLPRNKKLLIGSHHIETKLVDFGKISYGVIATPSTYARAWRSIREDGKITEAASMFRQIKITETATPSVEKFWQIDWESPTLKPEQEKLKL